jgi:RNA polymerase sigma factor (sigma-70 family)
LERTTDDRERCVAMVAALSVELGWHLELDQQQTYVSALLQYLPITCSEAELRRLVVRYHQDHAIVQALRDQTNPEYAAAWAKWCGLALRILRRQGFGSADLLSSDEDLAQVTLEELIRALPSFQYASRFSTWAYAVISRSAQRYLRDRKAAKRSGRTESLEQHEELDVAAPEAERPEALAEAHELAALVGAVLSTEEDQRLAEIFRRWASKDERLVDIARSVHLSPSRVSVLIEHICQLLQQSPAILAWLGGDASEDVEQAFGEEPGRTNDPPNRYT